jgi:hypothetical protein
VNDAVGTKRWSVLPKRPVIGQVTIKLEEKNWSMLGNVVTIVILFVVVQRVRPDHIKGSVSTECIKKIADINTGIRCRCDFPGRVVQPGRRLRFVGLVDGDKRFQTGGGPPLHSQRVTVRRRRTSGRRQPCSR